MKNATPFILAVTFFHGAFAASALAENEDSAAETELHQATHKELHAGDDKNKRYFLIHHRDLRQAPEEGHPLLLILPGGDGGPDFLPFIKRVALHALPEDYLVAELVAPKWNPQQAHQIIWPTRTDDIKGKRFSTEEFVEAVIEDVKEKHAVNNRRIFLLAWSSGGPAAYAISLRGKTSVKGFFIAMSVYKGERHGDLGHARDRAFFLYHSPEDRVCPFRMALEAREELPTHGAKVTLKRYTGGHGWRGSVYADIRSGIAWLQRETDKRTDTRPASLPAP